MTCQSARPAPAFTEALPLPNKRRVRLAVHDASFPAPAGEDSGCGAPYDKSGEGLLSQPGQEAIVTGNPCQDGQQVAYSYAFTAYAKALDEVHACIRTARENLDPAAVRLDTEPKDLERSKRQHQAFCERLKALDQAHGRQLW